MTVVFMFPGQSSRYPGMLHKLVELYPRNREVLAMASEILRCDLVEHYRSDNAAAYARNRDVQIGVFLANHMFLEILTEAGLDAELSLGLSLGEYNHLVHIGALDFPTALRVVERRGEAYDAGPSGAMASIFPITEEALRPVVERVRVKGVLEIVNLNSPKQQVLSGERVALDAALEILEEETFVSVVIIERQIPMHCSIFEPVGQQLRVYLENVEFQQPRLPYFPNRLGRILEVPDRTAFVDLLATHVYHPVYWRASIDWVVARWPGAIFVEVGPLAVLHNLLDRRWHPNRKFHMDSAEGTGAHLQQVIAELQTLRRRDETGNDDPR